MAKRKTRRLPHTDSIIAAIAVIGDYLKTHGAHVEWGGSWNKSTIVGVAMASWLDAMKAAQFPAEAQIAAWVERYQTEYLAAGSPSTLIYVQDEMLALIEQIADILRDYCSAGLIYFGEARFSARLIFAMSLWRYAEEIQATQATQESGA